MCDVIHTTQTLRNVGDPTTTHIWVKFKQPIAGHLRGRLVGIGRKYCRVMFGDGTILSNCLPVTISFVTTGVDLP